MGVRHFKIEFSSELVTKEFAFVNFDAWIFLAFPDLEEESGGEVALENVWAAWKVLSLDWKFNVLLSLRCFNYLDFDLSWILVRSLQLYGNTLRLLD